MHHMLKLSLFLVLASVSGLTVAQSSMTVEAVSPKMQNMQFEVHASGYVTAKEIVLVNSEVNGLRLDRIMVDVGDQVRQGDVLAKFDDSLAKQMNIQAKAQLKQAEIALQEASVNAQRASRLLRSNALSKMDAQKMIMGAEQAKAQAEAAKAQLAIQSIQLEHVTVRAPVTGLISEKKAVLGMTAMPGQPLFQIIADNQLAWQAKVGIDDLSRIHLGQKAFVTLPDGQQVSGEVYNIAPTVDLQSREVTVSVALAYTPGLHAGMLLGGVFDESKKSVMVIPTSTMLRDDDGPYVWVIGQDDIVHRRSITITQRQKGFLVVGKGLELNDRIVLRGGGFLNENDRVHVVASATEEKR